MDKICPDCGGKKGKWRHTHNSLNPVYPHVFIDCKTCKGKDKIPVRDSESIIEELEDICGKSEYILGLLTELKNRLED